MKSTLLTLFLITLMGVGNASGSNASANAAASAAPVSDTVSAAADVKLGAAQAAEAKPAGLAKESEKGIDLQQLKKALLPDLVRIIKHLMKGSFVVINRQTDAKRGFVSADFMGKRCKVQPGGRVDLFALMTLDALIARLEQRADEHGDVVCTITYFDSQSNDYVSEQYAVRSEDCVRHKEIAIAKLPDGMSVETTGF